MASRAARAPSCRCRMAATTAAPFASFPLVAAIRARYPWARRSRRCAGCARAAIARSFSPASISPAMAGSPPAGPNSVTSFTRKFKTCRRLREKGEAALRRHLDAQVGRSHRVLTESRELGRTEHFTRARLATPMQPGIILDVTITGHDGRQLLAV